MLIYRLEDKDCRGIYYTGNSAIRKAFDKIADEVKDNLFENKPHRPSPFWENISRDQIKSTHRFGFLTEQDIIDWFTLDIIEYLCVLTDEIYVSTYTITPEEKDDVIISEKQVIFQWYKATKINRISLEEFYYKEIII